MKRLFTIVLISIQFGYSQAYLKSTFTINQSEGFFSICKIDANRSLLLGGKNIVAQSSNFTPNRYGSFLLTTINNLGNVMDVTELELIDPVIPGCIKKTSDGGYIIAGGMQPGSSSYALVVKLDSNLSIEWEKQFDYGMFNDIEETPTAYIAVGAVPTGEGNDWSCAKMTKTGTLLWEINYTTGSAPGETSDDEAFDLIVENDGELTMIGKYYDVINHITYDYNCGIIHADSAGNIIWQRKIYGGGFGRSIIQLASGSYMGCSLDIVFKLSPNGNFSWGKSGIGWAAGLHASGVSNEYILTGHKGITKDAYSAAIDSNGSILFYNNYNFGEESHFYSLMQLSNNQWIGCGIEYLNGYNNYDSSMACLIMGDHRLRVLPNCQDTISPTLSNIFPGNGTIPMTRGGVLPLVTNNSVHTIYQVSAYDFNHLCTNGIGIEENAEIPFTIYPNPTSDYLFLSSLKENLIFQRLSVYNTMGGKIYSVTNEMDLSKLDLRNYPVGIYFLVVETIGKTYTTKIVKD